MKINKYCNTTKKEVYDKNFNVWIGISLGNKYFTKENIKKYIEWGVKHTKEDILVVIADRIHSINLEILDKKTKNVALNRALKLGEQKYLEFKEILFELSDKISKKVTVVKWNDVTSSDYYKKQLKIVMDEFRNNRKFHDHIIGIVKDGRKDRKESLDKLADEKMDRLAQYIIEELPLFTGGVHYNNTVYTLIPYPGFTKLDELFIGLQNKTIFPELAKKLDTTNKIQILEAYVE